MCKIASCSFKKWAELLQLLVQMLPHSSSDFCVCACVCVSFVHFWKMKMLKLKGFQAAQVFTEPDETEVNCTELDSGANNQQQVFTLPWRRTQIGFLPVRQRETRLKRISFVRRMKKEKLTQNARSAPKIKPHMQSDLPFLGKKSFHLWPRWKQIWAKGTNEKSGILC